LQSLTKAQLIEILTKVKYNLIGQYRWLFDQDGIELEFDQESIELIANKAYLSKAGARGLQNELERILLPHMFDLSKYRRQNILQVVIDKTQVNTPMTLIQENL
jgi:ATP-dependent Clp protease ATP-binding subunit ClpX